MSVRTQRVEHAYTRELTQILRFGVRDPRLADIYITRVVFTPDLKIAKAYYNGTNAKLREAEIEQGLESSTPFFRREMAIKVPLKFTPEIKFFYDDSYEEQIKMQELFHQIEKDRAAHEKSKESKED